MYYALTASALAASAFFNAASGSPIQARDVCGAAPAGTAAQTPLAQPTGITTADLCAAQCKAQSGCESFLFGMVDNVDTCELFSVAASSLPPQTDLVAYDIGCSSFPSVVPTASNPTGVEQSSTGSTGSNTGTTGQTGNTGSQNGAGNQRRQQGTHAAPINAQPAGNPAPIATPTVDSLAACLAACQGNPACTAYTFASNICKLFNGNANNKMIKARQQGTHAAPINAQPAGNPAPIATPAVDSLAACLAACQGNPSCTAYTFASGTCKLFNGNANNKMIKARQQGTHAAPMNAQPAGNPTPIATPAVDSLAACLAACQGNPSCTAYTFASGTCKLFNGNANNKMIKARQQGTHAAPMNAQPAGNPTPIATPAVDSLAACLAACQGNPACTAYTFASGTCKLFNGNANNKMIKSRQTHANPQNEIPAGNPTPIATPSENSLDACLAACQGNPNCIAYTFINNVCDLFGPLAAREVVARQSHAAPQNQVPAGNPTPIAMPAEDSLDACLAACQGNPSCIAYTFDSGVCKLFA